MRSILLSSSPSINTSPSIRHSNLRQASRNSQQTQSYSCHNQEIHSPLSISQAPDISYSPPSHFFLANQSSSQANQQHFRQSFTLDEDSAAAERRKAFVIGITKPSAKRGFIICRLCNTQIWGPNGSLLYLLLVTVSVTEIGFNLDFILCFHPLLFLILYNLEKYFYNLLPWCLSCYTVSTVSASLILTFVLIFNSPLYSTIFYVYKNFFWNRSLSYRKMSGYHKCKTDRQEKWNNSPHHKRHSCGRCSLQTTQTSTTKGGKNNRVCNVQLCCTSGSFFCTVIKSNRSRRKSRSKRLCQMSRL